MNTDSPIRVLIADDHPVVREGLRSFLATRPGIEVVGEAEDVASALAVTEELRPDVVLVDLMMPGGGIDAIKAITALDPAVRCLVLTSFVGDNQVIPALRAGAAGYLLKDIDPDELVIAIRTAHAGGTLLAPQASGPVVAALRSTETPERRAGPDVSHTGASDGSADVGDDRLAELTPREREVLTCLARGLTNRAIADELYVSEKTVKTHVSMILSKLRVADRTQAAVYALRHGIG